MVFAQFPHEVHDHTLDGAGIAAGRGPAPFVQDPPFGIDDAGSHLGPANVDPDGQAAPPQPGASRGRRQPASRPGSPGRGGVAQGNAASGGRG